MLTLLVLILVVVILSFLTLRTWVHQVATQLVSIGQSGQRKTVVAFFHPYCDAGGGGERVLWCAIKAIHDKFTDVTCVVYTGDVESSPDDIVNRARNRFNISLSVSDITFVYLNHRSLVEAGRYPHFTLLGQSLASMWLGFEAMMKCIPDIYIDSMGYAFTLPVFKYLGGSKVLAYVHYPTISSDMLSIVTGKSKSYNNSDAISRSNLLSYSKLLYYRVFAIIYGLVGRSCDLVMVNSSWTQGHIDEIWGIKERTVRVYPPCNVEEFLKHPLESGDEKYIVSIGQFRPEKNHLLQLRSFAEFIKMLHPEERMGYKLKIVGSVRHKEDEKRVDMLRQELENLELSSDQVQFHINVSFDELHRLLGGAAIGLHTMWNEHFGIGIVEMMAAGTIVLAHDSGGPKLDIVTPFNELQTGYLADTVKSYADAMTEIFQLNNKERQGMREIARSSVERFSDSVFRESFLETISPIFPPPSLPNT